MTPLLRVTDACHLLGVGRSWLYDACARGVIPHIRLGGPDGPLRFDPDDLKQFIHESKEKAA